MGLGEIRGEQGRATRGDEWFSSEMRRVQGRLGGGAEKKADEESTAHSQVRIQAKIGNA